MRIHELLSPQRIQPSLPAASKKRLLERLSFLLGAGDPDVDVHAAFQSLIERERLGSTGIGEGVALPHGRLKGLKKAVGAFVTLEHAMDYDAIDRKPVKMAFALLVPEEATEEHLRILAELAGIFSNKETRRHLLEAKSADELFRELTKSAPTHS
ncbi:MAG: PTS IIA-like nitrogen-regulatory protein PtsN [Candidatus Muproteobacteria bacterium RBG_16_65_34]|uniref:PTS IIA-like nitrogen-regulatory protein PtsN n=1 Tax=Candidatus Muproteobacteria bacterium RBG_16_65_34 TaxID=1817760 RepID=A0A1F6TV34_9PROT|nr:MAG: PTS IIA-like nitrogen-regulatory protein PtsN [Candidatus Muproteobacteria bacterium RBG_16_65_34]